MNGKEFSDRYKNRFHNLATSNLADAMDKVGIRGAVIGILPMYDCPKIFGQAVTIKLTAAGVMKSKSHLGVEAINLAQEGDVLVIDNRGDLRNNCWGEVLSMAAKLKKVSGVIADGAVRDIDACREFQFPVYARGTVPITARGRLMQESFNEMVRIGDIQVRPGDVVVADANGVVVIPHERLDEVLLEAEALFEKESAMIEDLKQGMSILDVDRKYAYEKMLQNDEK